MDKSPLCLIISDSTRLKWTPGIRQTNTHMGLKQKYQSVTNMVILAVLVMTLGTTLMTLMMLMK